MRYSKIDALRYAMKKLVKIDFAIGIVIAAVAWASLGTEGMAREFCENFKVDRCQEVFGDDY